MQRSVWRLAAASGLAACLALGAVPAGASGSDGRHRPPPGPVQVAHQGGPHRAARRLVREVRAVPAGQRERAGADPEPRLQRW